MNMKPISLHRFEALAGYARSPTTVFYAEELSRFEHANERVLGLLIRDRADNDFGGVIFGRDEQLRYRWVAGTAFFERRRLAEVGLRREMERVAAEPDEFYHQGGPKGPPVDFFAKVVTENRLHPSFVKLRDEEVFSAAREIID